MLPIAITSTNLAPISNLPIGETPEAIRDRIPMLKTYIEKAYVRFAKDIWLVYNQKYYTKWGFNTFDDWIASVGVSKDGAYKARRIFDTFVMKCGIPPKEIDEIGKSRAEKLLPVIDKTNVKEWVTKAKELGWAELCNKVEVEKIKRRSPPPEPTQPDSGIVVGPVSLGNSTTQETPRVIKEETKHETFRVRTFRLPDESDTLLEEALAEAQRITGSHSAGYNLSCIAQHFLAHRMTNDGKDDGRLLWFMRQMERIYNCRLIRIKSDDGWELLKEAVENNPDHLGDSKEEVKDE